MRDYELVVLLPVGGKEESILAGVKKTVEGVKGKIGKVENWGTKALKYPIAKQKEATYFLLNVNLQGTDAPVVDRTLRVNEDILRHLLVRKEEMIKSNPPSSSKTAARQRGVKAKKK